MTAEAKPPPPWVWDHQPDEVYAESWRRLAAWVEWLEGAYAPWVVLPACWPAHEGLRTELTIFWIWHRWLMTAAVNPLDGVRWHSDLRRAADAWRELASCRHDAPLRHQEQMDANRRERRDRFIAAVPRRGADSNPQ